MADGTATAVRSAGWRAGFNSRGALLPVFTGGRQNSRWRLRIARATVPSPMSASPLQDVRQSAQKGIAIGRRKPG